MRETGECTSEYEIKFHFSLLHENVIHWILRLLDEAT
jgi:hypothetical protein